MKTGLESRSTDTGSTLIGLVSGGRPIHVAVSNGNSDALETLLKLGVDANLTCLDGNSPLHHAAQYDNHTIAAQLLEARASPDALNRTQQTPLIIAAANGANQVASVLMALRYDTTTVDSSGRTALHYAAQQPEVEVFVKFFDAGFDPYQPDEENHSPVYYALSQSSLATFVYANCLDLSHLHSVQDGFQMPALPPGTWALRQFLRYASDDVRSQYMSWSAAPAIPSLIHYAILNDTVSVGVCIEAGADLEIRRHNGDTAVLAACRAASLDCVIFIVRQGAQLQYEDRERTLNVYRAAYGRSEIIEWLLVSRWTDQRKLASEPAHSEEHIRHRAWTGVRTIKIPLRGEYTRPKGSSLLDHAKYLHSVARKGWKILVPLGWDVIAHLVQLPSEVAETARAPQHDVFR